MEAPNWLGHPFAAEILALPKSQHFTNNDDRHALAQAMVDTIREPLLVLDKNLRVITANRSFYLMFRMNCQDVQGRPVYALGDGQWNIPELRLLLESIAPRHAVQPAQRRVWYLPWTAANATYDRARPASLVRRWPLSSLLYRCDTGCRAPRSRSSSRHG